MDLKASDFINVKQQLKLQEVDEKSKKALEYFRKGIRKTKESHHE